MQLRKKPENIQASMRFDRMTFTISLQTALPSERSNQMTAGQRMAQGGAQWSGS